MKNKNLFLSIIFLTSLSLLVACGRKKDKETTENTAVDTEISVEEQMLGDDLQPEQMPSHINFSGLYYDINNNLGYYLYWDTQKGEATSVYLSDSQGKWQKATIRSQKPSNFYEYQEAEQTVEVTYQNQPLKLIITKENEGAKGVTRFISSAEQQVSVLLANASTVPITESQPLSQHIAEALAGIKWQVRDPQTFQGSMTTSVSAKQQGNRVIFTLTEGSTKATFTCEVQKDNTIRCATQGFEDFSIKVKMVHGTAWELQFDAPTGEAIMTLISPR
ncbi:MAG: hypothetical protein OHK0057_17940 [Thermoflexibacter sp.]